MSDEKHNGWTNYATWAVALYIDNDQTALAYWRNRVEQARFAEDIAKELKNCIGYYDAPEELASPYSELLQAGLSQVNWLEIADHLVRKAKEQTK